MITLLSNRTKVRIAAALLTVSAGGFSTWQASEGFTDKAVIPTEGDRATIGHGSTFYEDGSPVKMGDTITRQRASELARNLMKPDEKRFVQSINNAEVSQDEFDLYMDFIGQYGIGNWRKYKMREFLLAGDYIGACKALLRYRYAAGYDCATLINGRPNKRCWGVWDRQLKRYDKCMGANNV